MRYCDYVLLQAGFTNKRVYDRKVLRKAVKKLLEPYVAKGKSLNDYQVWPEPGDKEEQKRNSNYVSEKNLARLKAFKEKELLQNKPKDN